MSDFDTLRDQTLALFPPLLEITAQRGADRARDRLLAARQQLTDASLTLVVCGEFKRGKSSLLNALLAEDPPLFPVDTVLATSLVTRVSWGETEEIVVELRDETGKPAEQRHITRAQIPEYATEAGNPDNAKGAAMIDIRTPNPRLTSGLVIVDTPGVGGMYTDHSAVTAAYLPNADAIVFVCSFDQAMAAPELRFLESAVEAAAATGDADGLVVAVTKSDRLGEAEQAAYLAGARSKLTELTGRPVEQLNIVPVSSLMKLNFLLDGDPQDLADSNFEAFEQTLWAATARRRARLILSTALADLDRTTQALLGPLDTERAALRARTQQRLDELAVESEARRRDLGALTAKQATWRKELRAAVGKDLLKQALDDIDTVWWKFETQYLEDPTYLDAPDEFFQRLVADASVVAATISEAAQQQAATALREFSRTHGLELSTPEVAALPAPTVPPIEVLGELRKAEQSGRQFERFSGGTIGSGVGGGLGGMGAGLVGGIIGTLVAPGVGTFLGAQLGGLVGGAVGSIVGGVKGYQKAVERQRHADRSARRRSLEIELKPLRKSQVEGLKSSVAALAQSMGDAVVEELDSRITQERESAADAAARLTRARQEAQADAHQRLEALDAECRPLLEARASITRLARHASVLGGGPPLDATAGPTTEPGAGSAAASAPTARPVIAAGEDDFADE